MKFAQFQSTYKPLPIQTYEQTGRELETKYFNNRQQASLFRQGMANTKVEDRNLGILAKTTSDVEGMLNEVNNNWQYASNVLYNAKDRIVNDKALNASMEDYAKSQATKQDLQDQFKKGEIDQKELDAFYINDKLYNRKPITLDENGQAKNRWATPTPPPKPDVDKQATKMLDIVLKNPDVVDTGLKTIFDKQGISSGYLQQVRTEQVSPEKIFGIIKGWMANSPEVKQYYQYINNADLLSKTTDILPDGNITSKSILPQLVSEYRNLGYNVDENGTLLDNYQHYVNPKGEFDIKLDSDGRKIEIKDASKTLLESADVKFLMNEGKLPLEDALKQSFLSHKLNGQLNDISSNYKDFAFEKVISNNITSDQEHWLQRKMQLEKEQNANIQYSSLDKVPMSTTTPYSTRDAQTTSTQLQTKLNTLKLRKDYESNPEYISTKQILEDQTQNITILSKSFLNSNEGRIALAEQWKSLVKDLPVNEQIAAYNKYYDDFTNYMQGIGTLPNITLGTETSNIKQSNPLEITAIGNPFGISRTFNSNTLTNKIENSKVNFQKELDKKIKSGLSIDNNYETFRDKDGNLSNFHKAQGEYIKTNGDSWYLPYSSNKQGMPVKIQDYMSKIFEGKGFNISNFDMLYFPVTNTSTGFGQGVVKLIPNKTFPNGVKVPNVEPIVVRPDASIKNSVLRSNARYVRSNSIDPEATNWANEADVMSIYGDTFVPLFNNIANGVKLGDSQDVKDQRTIRNVRFGNKEYTMFLDPQPAKNSDGTVSKGTDYNLYLDPISVKENGANYPTDQPVATGKSLIEAINNLYTQHLKIRPETSTVDTGNYNKEGITSFLKAVGNRESGNNPNIINSQGYIGKYQFGQDALDSAGFSNINKNNFKQNSTLWPEEDQDTAMIKLMGLNEKALADVISTYDKAPNGQTITKSGILAAAHIGGAQGVRKYFESNGKYNPADANGTTIEDYLLTFSGYKI